MKPRRAPGLLPPVPFANAIELHGTQAVISSNTLDGGPGNGLWSMLSSGTIQGNTIQNFAGVGLYVGSLLTRPLTIQSNLIASNLQAGIFVGQDGAQVLDNTLTNNTHLGIAVMASDVVVSGGSIDATQLASGLDPYTSGTAIFAGDSTTDIEGVSITGAQGPGIVLECDDLTAATPTIRNNTIQSTVVAGIDVQSCTNGALLDGNMVTNVKGTGIRVLSTAGTVELTGNTTNGTLAFHTGMDGDGVLISSSGVLVDSGTSQSNARLGMLVDGLSTGFVNMIALAGNLMDVIVIEGGTGVDPGMTPANFAPAGAFPTDTKRVVFVPPGG
jgi:hypothetical protein